MAKNKITHRWEDHGVLVFEGTLRQPTAVEINNYCAENGVRLEGLYVASVKISGGWIPPEDLREAPADDGWDTFGMEPDDDDL